MKAQWILMAVALVPLARAYGAENSPQPGFFETTTVWPAYPRNRPNYRIPAILLAPNGDLLVFAEKRNDGPADVGDHDLVMKRSRDQGKTWDAEVVVLDDGPNNSTDPTLLLDAQRGVIWLFFLRDKVRYSCLTSADSGYTWSGVRSIHDEVTRPEWNQLSPSGRGAKPSPSKHQGQFWNENWVQRYGVGPGWGAIQVRHGPKTGRLLVPARHLEGPQGGPYRSFSHVFFSDDHGDTWRLGSNAVPDGNECRLIELANGDVMIQARDADNHRRPDKFRRLMAVSHDGGDTWGEASAAAGLACPQCHASLRRYSTEQEGGRNRILFSNPNSGFRTEKHPYGRVNVSVRISNDEGQSWSKGKTVYPYASSYTDLVVLPDGFIGLVYERGPKNSTHYWDEIQFARFDLAWLTDGVDRGQSQPSLRLPGKANTSPNPPYRW